MNQGDRIRIFVRGTREAHARSRKVRKERIRMKLKSIAFFALAAAAAGLFLPAGAQAQNVTYTYAYQGPALPIARDSANLITLANIFVPRAIRIAKVTANIEIDYPRPGDLNI